MEGATPMSIAPIVNSISAINMVGFLPILSDSTPPDREAMAAPIIATETIVSF